MEQSIKQEKEMLHSSNATQQKSPRRLACRARNFNEISAAAKLLPPATKLYGNLFYKGEVSILAGDTGSGKSMLAVDLAIKLALGISGSEPLINQAEPVRVCYFDLELSDVQFSKRYPMSSYPENLLRIDTNPECEGCSLTIDDIIHHITEHKSDIVVLDNLSAFTMRSGKDADMAMSIMHEFKKLQKQFGTTIIAVSHIPKRYENVPLRIDDVVGSKQITNFADSVVFIGKSVQGSSIRYLKQVKGRNEEFNEEAVYTMKLKTAEFGLCYEFQGMSSEYDHISKPNISGRNERNEAMKQMHVDGMTLDKIGELFGIHKSTVSRAIE